MSPRTAPTSEALAAEAKRSARDVARHLRERIQGGDLRPGVWLREIKLAAELNASRSAVREALRLLEQDGLVELEKFRGARVTAPTLYEMFDLFEIRAALFGLVARFACFRASDADIAELAGRIDQLVATAPDTPSDERVQEGVRIGALMARHANRDAQAMMTASHRKARWHYSYLGLAENRSTYGPLDDWRALATALRERDANAAAQSARNVIYFMQQEVTKVLVSRGVSPA
jgi:DNA-binding GntR family transcriptional regulator